MQTAKGYSNEYSRNECNIVKQLSSSLKGRGMVSQEALERQASRQLAQEGAAAGSEACFSTREVRGWRQRQEEERGLGGPISMKLRGFTVSI